MWFSSVYKKLYSLNCSLGKMNLFSLICFILSNQLVKVVMVTTILH